MKPTAEKHAQASIILGCTWRPTTSTLPRAAEGAACASGSQRRTKTPRGCLLGALPTNEGSSITYAAEQMAAEVIRYHRLPAPVVWIEHHPPITTDGDTETFDLLDFSG